MGNIKQVELKIKPYSDVIELAVNEMIKAYSYAPYSHDVATGAKHVGSETTILLKQAALLEPGQSTEVRELQSQTLDVVKALSRSSLSEYIREMTGAKFIVVTGDKMQIELTAQAHRRNDGCTIHTNFDVKYGGAGRMVSRESTTSFCSEENIRSDLHMFEYNPFNTLREQTGVAELKGNVIEFVKKLRDNDLVPGINLSSLSDEEIEDRLKDGGCYGGANLPASVVHFLIQHSGLSIVDFLEKWLSIIEPTARFDLSELSFHFEYDIEIDEETFQSYFTIDSDEEYEAKLAEQAKHDQIKTNAKPKVLSKLEEVLSGYDFDLEDLAEQIAEREDKVEVYDEIEDDDDSTFFSICDDFAKSSTYVVHAYDGGCSHVLTGDRKDGHVYSFELETYLITGGYGYTFIILDGELIELDSDSFSISDAFDLLASAAHCSVLELPQLLVEKGYKDFDNEELLSADDESQVYDWVENNVYAGDIIHIIEEEELIEVIVGEYDRTDDKFEIDFSDCFED